MKFFGILAGFAAIAAVSAHAQGVPASAPTPVTAASAGTIESARKLIEAMHLDQTYDRMFKPLTGLMAASLLPAMEKDPSVPADVRAELGTNQGQTRIGKIIRDELYASFHARYGKMKEATAKEYAAAFTEEELQTIIAFYSSGVGAKVLSLAPEISAKMAVYGQTVGREAGEEAYRHVLDRLDTKRGA